MNRNIVTIDGNEAAAYVAHKTNEVIAIYPITPSSPMGEWSDEWSAEGQKNIWGTVPVVVEMQSEGGASGAVHGALQTGALSTTFTSAQGLMLMIPNMFKIAGELTPTVFHVAARSMAIHALSIFGDHSDVMATRSTGFAMIASASIQEVMDFALIAQAATLEARVPFVHFFDGFRTSHEVNKIEQLTVEDMRAMIDEELIRQHRARALSPEHPVLRGSAQNPDVYFQGRETVNRFYLACPGIVEKVMNKFAGLVGRQYKLFDYVGAPDAERVIVLMGSGAETAHETVEYLVHRGEKVGVIKVRLYRPFSVEHFVNALPATVKVIAALDRTKEPGALGEPLYLDVVTAVNESLAKGNGRLRSFPKIIGGRYGLSSKEFTPAMIKGVFDEMKKAEPKNHFTVGINDDVTHTSIAYDPSFSIEPDDVIRAMFYGLGADGTVSANKNTIKIIGEETPNYAQGYFVYDSKKSGAMTVSHLRFGPRPIHSTYLVKQANFIGCHQFGFVEKYDMLSNLVEGGTFLLNSPYGPKEVWDHLPRQLQRQLIDKKAKFYVIDGYAVAKETGMGARINTIMQTCFFAISGVLPREEAIAKIKETIKKTYGAKGDEIVQMNYRAVDQTLERLYEVKVPSQVTSNFDMPPVVPEQAPDYVKNVLGKIIAGYGDEVPVSAMPVDGTFPTATSRWEKRAIALEIPIWDKEVCIQCNKCAIVCPHAAIRIKIYEDSVLANAPATFAYTDARDREWKGMKYTVQVAPEDCTGCGLCVEICPAKNKRETRLKAINMKSFLEHRETERVNFDFFLTIPELDRRKVKVNTVKGSQLLQPLFEFSGACAGCGETPYVKLVSQLFGDRAIIANATGCSSIYGGNLPTTPYAKNPEGRGPAWSNSLFEDNAEFGFGFRLTIDKHKEQAEELLHRLAGELGRDFVQALLTADQSDETGIYAQRERVALLKDKLSRMNSPAARNLLSIADFLVKKSVWIVGGDGWAYDIGYGGLDHVFASGKNVNILVLDTEVYSNTGGQMSKATPRGAVAKFAAGGKPRAKKDLAMLAMTYGTVYVASVAMGANDTQTVQAFIEAEQYDGPSLIVAYSHCIAHGINMTLGMEQQKLAVNSGYWPIFRYNPKLAEEGKPALHLDCRPPSIPVKEYMYRETRFKMLTKSNPAEAERLLQLAQQDVNNRWRRYEHWAAFGAPNGKAGAAPKREE
ncbi:MAG: pyruvate:ferredoxin (flavodoxin) oxidoreductase [candidate division KSB1 bacterium]|nr:pyruvate:ferredoxin (flavodoxin) oxidoreductase [candidate division KSB1 bacterium]MDZ7301804.1 pyruvate:ferredoxin (flavodoxin) oxidoreductase [candidate division KSB1 bacterium]MDZ7311417.1 pyruvate:ferredoxin (flavodoxin) oxidoreductase [candidate division KSB1 bacterium]